MFRVSIPLFVGALFLGHHLAAAAERESGLEPAPDRVRARVKELRAQGVERPLRRALEELAPLSSQTVGARAPTPRAIVPPGDYSLSLEKDLQLGGFVFKEDRPFLHNDGGFAAGNTALGLDALVSGAPMSYANTALGQEALRGTSNGTGNTAAGYHALRMNSTGARNVAAGFKALVNNDQGFNNTAVGNVALYSNDIGDHNTAVGSGALLGVTSGFYNVAVGSSAIAGGNGTVNVAVGHKALQDGGAGGANTAVGALAAENTTSFGNVAVGNAALRVNSVGFANTAIGAGALVSVRPYTASGYYNTALGYGAGEGIYYGSYNITIGTSGSYTEYNTIRLGDPDMHTRTFVAGVRGVTTDVADAMPVMIDSEGQLGTTSSSRRFKEGIIDIGGRSRALLDLRPVAFRFKSRPLQEVPEFGLIAEEVAEVLPELLVRDSSGRPETVKYQALPVLLVNELQRQQRELRFHRWALLLLGVVAAALSVSRRRRGSRVAE